MHVVTTGSAKTNAKLFALQFGLDSERTTSCLKLFNRKTYNFSGHFQLLFAVYVYIIAEWELLVNQKLCHLLCVHCTDFAHDLEYFDGVGCTGLSRLQHFYRSFQIIQMLNSHNFYSCNCLACLTRRVYTVRDCSTRGLNGVSRLYSSTARRR